MKSIAILPAVFLLASLTGCGLRGDLERPAPMFGDPDAADPPPADLRRPVQDDGLEEEGEEYTERVPGTSYTDPATGQTVWVQNEGGGVKPLPSPTTDLEESNLPPVSQ